MTTPSSESPIANSSFVSGLKEINQILLGWAASLTWTRLVILAIVVAIAASMIADKFDLEHGHHMVEVKGNYSSENADTPDEITIAENMSGCGEGDITIGNKKFQVVCEDKKATTPATPASGAARSRV